MTDNDNTMAMILLMNIVATSIKNGGALGKHFAEVGAVRIMPDGVAIYDDQKFRAVMTKMISEIAWGTSDNQDH